MVTGDKSINNFKRDGYVENNYRKEKYVARVGSNCIGNKGCMEMRGVGYMKNARGMAITIKKIGEHLSGAAARTGSLENISIKKVKKIESRRFV